MGHGQPGFHPDRLFVSLFFPAALLLGARPAAVHADDFARLGSAAPGYATSSVMPDLLQVGGEIHLRGRFLPDHPVAGYEYTWTATLPVTGRFFWDYGNPIYMGGLGFQTAGGQLTIFQDYTPDADFAQPSTFEDGTVLIECSGLHGDFVGGNGGYWVAGDVTGGMWAGMLPHAEGAAPALLLQRTLVPVSYDVDPIPPQVSALGYWANAGATLFVVVPVPVAITTWSRIKTLV